ncbi:MAG: 23S rRNA (guanosine(2251)-2'-O)-methyltransferase RlmB [Actinobacteria bacterium]|nr:23S rRNA (guanosine(2251)-2'-O)-methyltransferase RlmB [Actinomycetota bacterium]
MAGNSERKGAVRGSKKGASTGSGGNNKRRLEGKGPTPKAEDRPYHAAAKRKKSASKDTKSPTTRAPRTKSERPKGGGELVAGRNAVVEALRAGVPAVELIIARSIDVDDRITESLQLALSQHLPIRETHRAEVEGLSGSSQGILLAIKPYQYSSFEEILLRTKKPSLIVALDGVTDPRNLGAVVRSAAAFGADGVVMTERRAAAMTASAWKSSAGAAARIQIAQVPNLSRAIDDAKKNGCFVVGLDGDAEKSLGEMNLADESLMIVVGSEGKGLSRLVREKCDLVVSIPMRATTESLNASVATSIALFWVDEQRSKK